MKNSIKTKNLKQKPKEKVVTHSECYHSYKENHEGNVSKQELKSEIKNEIGRGSNVLITGGTGFVGDLIIKKYLERTDCILWILVRTREGVSLYERVLHRIDPKYHHRIHILKGDISKTFNTKYKCSASIIEIDDSESYNTFLEMQEVVDEVFHNGSYLGLKNDPGEKQKCINVNVKGTSRLFNLLETFNQEIKAIFYTSTAFVHGIISDPDEFGEDNAITNGWLNHYEESKWKAEALIRSSGYPYRIFRPGIIAREKGVDILSSHTLYGVANVLEYGYQTLNSKALDDSYFIRVKGSVEAAHNIILRSELVDMMFDIRASNHEMNHTYNTVNKSNTCLNDVLYSILQNLNSSIKYEFVSEKLLKMKLNRIEILMEKMVYPAYEEYLFKKSPKFLMDNVKTALGKDYITDNITKIDRKLLLVLLKDYFKTKNSD